MIRPRLFLMGLLGLGALSTACRTARTGDASTVVLVSLDGFRWDFRRYGETPTLDSLAGAGVSAERLVPPFPSLTFPSHYTMATGLYPENHGIISNTMYDPERDAWFRISDRDAVEQGFWWGGEPVWLTAERQGITAATFFWPGTETAIQGKYATHWRPFDASIPNRERVDQVLAWLALPDGQRPGLITLYFEDVDGAAHDEAVDSPRVRRAIEAVDVAIGRLTAGIARLDVRNQVNVIVVSDHGMSERSPDRVVFMDDYLELDAVRVVDWHPVWMGYANDGDHERVYRQLEGAHPNITVYRRGDLPERFRLQHNARVPPVIAIADDGWSITTRDYFQRNRRNFFGHSHGYDNQLLSMGSLFIASGPAFAAGHTVPPFANVHLYELVCHLLGIEPASNDGSLDSVRMVLR